MKVERGSTFTFTRDLSYTVSILLTRGSLSAYARKNCATVEIRLYPSQYLTGKNTDRPAVSKKRSSNTELGAV